MIEPRCGLDAFSIPIQQRPHRKRMPQPMDVRPEHACRHGQRQLRQQIVAQSVAYRVRAHRLAAVPGVQRRTASAGHALALAQGQIVPHPYGQLRPEWHQATLAELGVSDLRDLAIKIYVAALQTRDLADAQAEPRQESEDRLAG